MGVETRVKRGVERGVERGDYQQELNNYEETEERCLVDNLDQEIARYLNVDVLPSLEDLRQSDLKIIPDIDREVKDKLSFLDEESKELLLKPTAFLTKEERKKLVGKLLENGGELVKLINKSPFSTFLMRLFYPKLTHEGLSGEIAWQTAKPLDYYIQSSKPADHLRQRLVAVPDILGEILMREQHIKRMINIGGDGRYFIEMIARLKQRDIDLKGMFGDFKYTLLDMDSEILKYAKSELQEFQNEFSIDNINVLSARFGKAKFPEGEKFDLVTLIGFFCGANFKITLRALDKLKKDYLNPEGRIVIGTLIDNSFNESSSRLVFRVLDVLGWHLQPEQLPVLVRLIEKGGFEIEMVTTEELYVNDGNYHFNKSVDHNLWSDKVYQSMIGDREGQYGIIIAKPRS